VKNVLLVLLISHGLCLANTDSLLKDSADSATIKYLKYKDSIKKVSDSLKNANDSLIQLINDNITVETITKSQNFYGESFNKIQNSYDIFLAIVCGLITIIGIFSGAGYFAIRNDKKEFGKLKIEFNRKLENLNNKITFFKEETDLLKKDTQTKIDFLFRELAQEYYNLATTDKDLKKIEDLKEYFQKITPVYVILRKVNLTDDDSNRFLASALHLISTAFVNEDFDIYKYQNKYLVQLVNDLLNEILRFIEYCEKMNTQKLLKKAKEYRDFIKDVLKRNQPKNTENSA